MNTIDFEERARRAADAAHASVRDLPTPEFHEPTDRRPLLVAAALVLLVGVAGYFITRNDDSTPTDVVDSPDDDLPLYELGMVPEGYAVAGLLEGGNARGVEFAADFSTTGYGAGPEEDPFAGSDLLVVSAERADAPGFGDAAAVTIRGVDGLRTEEFIGLGFVGEVTWAESGRWNVLASRTYSTAELVTLAEGMSVGPEGIDFPEPPDGMQVVVSHTGPTLFAMAGLRDGWMLGYEGPPQEFGGSSATTESGSSADEAGTDIATEPAIPHQILVSGSRGDAEDLALTGYLAPESEATTVDGAQAIRYSYVADPSEPGADDQVSWVVDGVWLTVSTTDPALDPVLLAESLVPVDDTRARELDELAAEAEVDGIVGEGELLSEGTIDIDGELHSWVLHLDESGFLCFTTSEPGGSSGSCGGATTNEGGTSALGSTDVTVNVGFLEPAGVVALHGEVGPAIESVAIVRGDGSSETVAIASSPDGSIRAFGAVFDLRGEDSVIVEGRDASGATVHSGRIDTGGDPGGQTMEGPTTATVEPGQGVPTTSLGGLSDDVPAVDEVTFPGPDGAPPPVAVGRLNGVDWALATNDDDTCLRRVGPGQGSWTCSLGDVVTAKPSDWGSGPLVFVAGAAPACGATVTVSADAGPSQTVPAEEGTDGGAWFAVALTTESLGGELVVHDAAGSEVHRTSWAAEVPVWIGDDFC